MQASDQQRIGERYELRECIGIGGMARVYRALDRTLNRDVAAKILDPALASDPLFVERFRREARSAASLNHPNIVTIFDTGATDDSYYIVMEYVEGPNLKERLRADGPLSEGDVLAIGAQVAAALTAAHERGLIHRDIKPHNVLITPDGTAKVTDFGIARAAGASQLTATQTVMGSAQYLSPEQALHHPLDGRSDIYSLGIVLYEALTGQLPFIGDSLVAVAMMQVHDPPVPLRAIRPEISVQTEAVVMKALAKDPAKRYQSANEMRAALLRARDASRDTAAVVSQSDTRPLPPGIAVIEPAHVTGLPANPSLTSESTVVPEYVSRDVTEHTRRRPFGVPVAIAAICLLLIGVGVFAFRAFNKGSTGVVLTPTAARAATTPQASTVSFASPTQGPTRQPTATSVTQATAVPLVIPTQVPTLAPAIATATAIVPTVPAPSPTPLAPAVATPEPLPSPRAVAPTQPAVPPSATIVGPVVAANSPAEAVQRFYQLVNQRQFDQAAQLWSPRMKAQFPPDDEINGRFSQTQSIEVRIGAVQGGGNDGQATVAVELTETRGTPATTSRYVGSWLLVRGPSGWLLDQPNLRPA